MSPSLKHKCGLCKDKKKKCNDISGANDFSDISSVSMIVILGMDNKKNKYTKSNRKEQGRDQVKKANKRKGKYLRKTNTWRNVLLTVAVVLIVSASILIVHRVFEGRELRKITQQVQQVEQNLPTAQSATTVINVPSTTYPATTEIPTEKYAETVPPQRDMLPQYVKLFQLNPDFYGWIRLENTVIDYPVMRSNDGNNEKYLHANFNAEYSFEGIPFVDIKCTHDSDNILIYGHNMQSGTMFRSLFKYENKNYWEQNPTIMFSDLYENYEYEVLAVFYDQIYRKSDICFKFYQFIDAEDEEEFDYAISEFKKKSLYDTGVDAEYGDKLITLITCAYHVDNGRFVVVARRK